MAEQCAQRIEEAILRLAIIYAMLLPNIIFVALPYVDSVTHKLVKIYRYHHYYYMALQSLNNLGCLIVIIITL